MRELELVASAYDTQCPEVGRRRRFNIPLEPTLERPQIPSWIVEVAQFGAELNYPTAQAYSGNCPRGVRQPGPRR